MPRTKIPADQDFLLIKHKGYQDGLLCRTKNSKPYRGYFVWLYETAYRIGQKCRTAPQPQLHSYLPPLNSL